MVAKKVIKEVWRFPFRVICKIRLKKHGFSLISSNCIGGGYYHDCFSKFYSPTINLTIGNSIGFFEDIKKYMELDMVDGGVNEYGYPLAKLDDVIITGVHYKSFYDLSQAWEKRKKRVDYNNIYIITTDEFIKTKEDCARFDKLQYPKVCFISKREQLKYNWQIYIPKYEHLNNVGDVMTYVLPFGKRKCEKYFDYIYWINNKRIKGMKEV